MNRTLPVLSIFIFFLVLFSCKEEAQKSQEKNEADLPSEPISSIQSQEFTTQSGKVFELIELSDENGLFDFHIVSKGFEFSEKDTMIIKGADRISNVFLADLDGNGFEEIYLITQSDGSGSYANIYGYSSNADKSISPIYVRPIEEVDLAAGALFEGYMGHDSIFMEGTALKRVFPKYQEGDANCCPTGGKTILTYKLKAGEASWQLQATRP